MLLYWFVLPALACMAELPVQQPLLLALSVEITIAAG